MRIFLLLILLAATYFIERALGGTGAAAQGTGGLASPMTLLAVFLIAALFFKKKNQKEARPGEQKARNFYAGRRKRK
ncbi:MAG TPA: hypothetical protein VN446_02400 [Candidatus Acidoferrum sp.]|nr:hypothetical protein [Candidatus Acidoferrum sp.]